MFIKNDFIERKLYEKKKFEDYILQIFVTYTYLHKPSYQRENRKKHDSYLV